MVLFLAMVGIAAIAITVAVGLRNFGDFLAERKSFREAERRRRHRKECQDADCSVCQAEKDAAGTMW